METQAQGNERTQEERPAKQHSGTKAGRELHSLAEDCKESECEVQRENTAWQPSLFLTKVTAETKLSVKGIIY